MNIVLRPATIEDVDALVTMMREFNAIDNYPFDEAVKRRALCEFIGNDALGALFVIADADRENQAIGYAALTFGYSFEFHGRDAFLDELYLDANYRSRGVGSQAMQFLEAQCHKLGIHAVHLEVERDNLAAQSLYRKFGFADHDRYLMTKWTKKKSGVESLESGVLPFTGSSSSD